LQGIRHANLPVEEFPAVDDNLRFVGFVGTDSRDDSLDNSMESHSGMPFYQRASFI
jgi:hypothetical protein